MILIYSSKLVLYILFKHSKISKSFEKQLTLENKVTSYLDYLDYLKSKIPYVGFSINLDTLYTENDSKEVREFKRLFIESLKTSREKIIKIVYMILFAMFLIFIMFLFDINIKK